MAENASTNTIKLPKEYRERLEQNQKDIEKAKNALEALKKLGIEGKDIEDKLKWAEKVNKAILENFVE